MNTILLLHGALGSKSQLDALKVLLEKRGLRVFSMNFSSHGGTASANAGFGIQVFAEEVVHFMDLHDLRVTDIFGYSMGGYVALWLAHRHPARIGKITTLGTKFDWDEASARKEINKLDPEKIMQKVPAFARALENRHAPQDWKELLHLTGIMMQDLGQKNLLTHSVLKSIRHQVVICAGENDDVAGPANAQAIAELLRFGKFIMLWNTSHPIEKVDLKTLEEIILYQAG